MHSLRVKLLAPFILGTLALTMVLSWYTYSSARNAVRDAMMLISEAETSHVSASIGLLFKSMSTSLQNMVADPHVTSLFDPDIDKEEALEKTKLWLDIIVQGNEYYRDIIIVDKDGVCIASSNPGHIGTSYGDRDYVRRALTGMFNFGESSVGRLTKKFSATNAGPIDVAGQVAGALIVFNDFPRIVDYDAGARHNNQTVFTALLAPDGVFMAHRDKQIEGNRKLADPDLYIRLAVVGRDGKTVSYALNGQRYIGYAKVEPFTNWTIVTSGKTGDVFASAYRVGFTVLGISFLFLFVITLVVVRFANGILSTLLSLISYAKHVSEGAFTPQLEDTDRNDELGVLHTSLQRLVDTLQAMLEETREASKMKGQFLANMSHEIRTPLNAIIGMVHLSLRDPGIPEKLRDYLGKIHVAAKSLLGILNDILDISKVEAGMLTLEEVPFNLRELLRSTMDIHLENASRKALELEFIFDEDAPEHVLGDSLRIGQVVNNLISNAIKFTSKGSVKLGCEFLYHTDIELPGDRSAPPEAAMVRISVQDTGIGISQEALANLFQPFTQADSSITRKFGGTGLGLAISDKLVAIMGGTMFVSSEPGAGTTFSFTIPLVLDLEANDDEQTEISLTEAFESLALTGKRILVAEDNAINQMIIQELMEPSGAEIVTADNGLEAFNAVNASRFDLVLMDMQMPIMDGLDATRRIRATGKHDDLPIIAVTANVMKEDKERGMASGMNGYIAKPIEPHELLVTLRAWLVEAPAENAD